MYIYICICISNTRTPKIRGNTLSTGISSRYYHALFRRLRTTLHSETRYAGDKWHIYKHYSLRSLRNQMSFENETLHRCFFIRLCLKNKLELR